MITHTMLLSSSIEYTKSTFASDVNAQDAMVGQAINTSCGQSMVPPTTISPARRSRPMFFRGADNIQDAFSRPRYSIVSADTGVILKIY